jgi:putative FmdB family regulatory protein
MPIYEFKCLKCDEFFEVIIMSSDDDKAVACPKCKSTEFERIVSKTSLLQY